MNDIVCDTIFDRVFDRCFNYHKNHELDDFIGKYVRIRKYLIKDYRKYLLSINGNNCEYCKESKDYLVLHHNPPFISTYKKIPTEYTNDEFISMIIDIICQDCHNKIHPVNESLLWGNY